MLCLKMIKFRPINEVSVLIAHAQKPPSNCYTEVSSGTRGLDFGLGRHPYFMLVDGHFINITYAFVSATYSSYLK